MSMNHIRTLEITVPESNDAWAEGIMDGVPGNQRQHFSEAQYHILSRMLANAFAMTRYRSTNYVQEVVENIVDELNKRATQDSLNATDQLMDNISKDVDALKPQAASLSTIVANLSTQMTQLPKSAQTSGGSRQPKIGEPPEFNGTDGKVEFQEWMNKIQLWVVHEDIVTDKHCITVAMNKLSGAAAQYMEPWIEKLMSGGTIGSWPEFVHELSIQYG